MKTYSRHYCERQHRSYRTLATCIWGKRAAWVMGEGPYAVLAWCRVLTVTLHETEEAALKSKAMIDDTACGGMCHRHHEVIQLQR